jgi:hypothetical protein
MQKFSQNARKSQRFALPIVGASRPVLRCPQMDREQRERLNKYAAEPEGWAPSDESEHFFKCKECGQWVDMRKLGDSFWHKEPGHDPIPEYPMDTRPETEADAKIPAHIASEALSGKEPEDE